MVMDTIGVVRSPYKERFGTPRQANVTAGVLEGKAQHGQLVFSRGRNFEVALEDLDGFDYVWVISYMHLNQGWNPKVKPPRGPRVKRGLFSTRSPHRPNSIALSAVKIVSVDPKGLTVTVEGLDLLDGTPILDIKPYVPYCDAFPGAKTGWLEELSSIDEVDYLPSKPPPFIK
ncbi:TsaA-like domain-containing protein [Tribonema minus]|uniref:TsaA-like domain-containing protein n=1 Tax=Tribonema minus TaxID=303371 RepID=A0A835YNQ9_9STRA|nr:TsaA-like domain-containing protein [Tribonema minus]